MNIDFQAHPLETLIYCPLTSLKNIIFQSNQLSCDSTTPEAEDRTKFKRYFQILPNDILFSQAFIQILNTFNWTKLHAINLEFHLFVQVCDLSLYVFKHLELVCGRSQRCEQGRSYEMWCGRAKEVYRDVTFVLNDDIHIQCIMENW